MSPRCMRFLNHRTILRTLALLICVFCCPILIQSIEAQEWTRFRGPDGSGISKNPVSIPAAWKDDDIRWKKTLPGQGHSSPVLWRNKLFLNCGDPENNDHLVLCIDSENGEILWTKKFASNSYHIHTQNSLASSTPAVDAERVYVSNASDKNYWIRALDHSGNEIWSQDLGPYKSNHGYGTSPIVHDDLIFITNDQDGPSYLIALNARTGKEVWRYNHKIHPDQNASYATPIVYQPANGNPLLIVNSWSAGFACHDPKSGELFWEKSVLVRRPVGSPVVADGYLLGNSGEGGGKNRVVGLKLSDENKEPSEAFTMEGAIIPYVPTVVAKDGKAYLWADRGIVTCVRVSDGKKIWQQRVGGNFSSSPVIVGDQLFGISDKGEVIVLKLGDKYELLGKNQLGETCRSTPAIANGKMYIHTLNTLHCIGGR